MASRRIMLTLPRTSQVFKAVVIALLLIVILLVCGVRRAKAQVPAARLAESVLKDGLVQTQCEGKLVDRVALVEKELREPKKPGAVN